MIRPGDTPSHRGGCSISGVGARRRSSGVVVLSVASCETAPMADGLSRLGRPTASSDRVRRQMERQRRRDTQPEMAIRRLLHAKGLRYRVNLAPLPGSRRRADIVFTAAMVAVFVDGCFWHRCPLHGTLPKANADWWLAKLDRNVERDRETDLLLVASGWQVLRFWEHEEPAAAAATIAGAVGARRQQRRHHGVKGPGRL